MQRISSKHNPFIQKIVRLKRKKTRNELKLFTFEGKKLFREATMWAVPIKHIILTETAFQRYDNLFNNQSANITIVSDSLFAYLSNQKNPEGILCIARMLPANSKKCLSGNMLILDGIKDPGNLGTMIRTADAAGFSAVYCLENTVDIYNEKTIRATMGSLFHLSVQSVSDSKEFLSFIKRQGMQICAAVLDGRESLVCPVTSGSVALVIGNESHGIRPEILTLCDETWKLPIFGHAESLNAAVAAGILMYTIARDQKI